jgi:hypothetical protein
MYDLAQVPGILRAFESIALDNGGINWNRSSEQHQRECAEWLDEIKDQFDIVMIDAWLSSLSDDDLETACNGLDTDMEALMQEAPPDTSDFLNLYFNEVC